MVDIHEEKQIVEYRLVVCRVTDKDDPKKKGWMFSVRQGNTPRRNGNVENFYPDALQKGWAEIARIAAEDAKRAGELPDRAR